MDFEVPEGTDVVAAREGIVVGVRRNSRQGGTSMSMMGQENFVWIQHSDRTVAQYLHFQTNSIQVSMSQTIRGGQVLGKVGCTGYCSEPHLHFHVSTSLPREVDQNNQAFTTFPTLFRISAQEARTVQERETLVVP